MGKKQQFQGVGEQDEAGKKAMAWMNSITLSAEKFMAADEVLAMQHAVRFYGFYLKNKDDRYMKLCEEFLAFAIKTTKGEHNGES